MSFQTALKQFQSNDFMLGLNNHIIITTLNGEYVQDTRGGWVITGGLINHTGIIAPPNSGKSELLNSMFASVGNNYPCTTGTMTETEGTLSPTRLTRASNIAKTGKAFDMSKMSREESPRFMLIDGTVFKLDMWADYYMDVANQRYKQRETKKYQVTLPFILNTNRGNKYLAPILLGMDSASAAQASSVTNLVEEGTDDKKGQTAFLRDGWVKTRVFGSVATSFYTKGDMFFLSTGALGDKGPDLAASYGSHPEKVNTHIGANKRLKYLGSSYLKLTSNLYQFGLADTFYKDKTTASERFPYFPENIDDQYPGNKDLEILQYQNLRGKTGASGEMIFLIRSQRDGILPGLSELYNCMKLGRKNIHDYGITREGNKWISNFTLDLLPDVTFTNRTVRGIFMNSHVARRAIEITVGMKLEFYIAQFRESIALKCTPKELYEDLKAMGYDWNVLLTKSRYYWQFIEDEDGELFSLSVRDLLLMRTQQYHPWWYPTEGIKNAFIK